MAVSVTSGCRRTVRSARQRLISSYAHDVTEPEWALGYTFDILLGRTPVEPS